VVDVMVPLADDQVVGPRDSAWLALMRLGRNRIGAVAVVDDGRVAGILTRHDIQKALADEASRCRLNRAA
jgi:CBS domain-containing protein